MRSQVTNQDGTPTEIGVFEPVPNVCPLCSNNITAQQIGAYLNINKKEDQLEIVYRCPNKKCASIFIGYFEERPGTRTFYLKKTAPTNFKKMSFSQTIRAISFDFEKIFNEAAEAEELNLVNICGSGYRKALEFLVKDYLLKQTELPDEKEAIKSEFLGTCIGTRIKDTNIKNVAQRAVWLGNDHTHYVRKWESKDLQDLKKLIKLTVHWMEAESLTAELLREMPGS